MSEQTKNTFTPTSELVEFAQRFSQNYKIMEFGVYRSTKGTYTIHYVKVNKDSPTAYWVSRVMANDNIIELQKETLLDNSYTADYIFFIILWCICLRELENHNLVEADILTLQYCLNNGMSKKNIYLGFCQYLSHQMNEQNINRIITLKDKLDSND